MLAAQQLPSRVDRAASPLLHVVDPDSQVYSHIVAGLTGHAFRFDFSRTADEFLSTALRYLPDAVVMNFNLGSDDGLWLLRRFKSMDVAADIPVVMLTKTPEIRQVVEAMRLGAASVVNAPVDPSTLLECLPTHGAAISLSRVSNALPATTLPTIKGLTPREAQVLELIASGLSNKEAGRRLNISPRTVEVHRARVMQKLNARNTADLMRIVLTGQGAH